MGKYDALLDSDTTTAKPSKYSTLLDGDVSPAAPKARARDQVTFLGSETLGKLMADVFPRVAEGTVKGRSYPAQVGAGLEDNASLPGRAIASTGAAPAGSSWKDGNPSLGDTKGKGFVDRTLRDPGVGAALMTAPFTGGMSIPIQGAIAGAASAAAHQGDNALEGRDVSPGAAGLEVALSTAFPVLANRAGQALQARARGIVQTSLKSNQKIAGEKILSPEQADTFLNRFGSMRGLNTSEARIAETHRTLNERFAELIDQVAANKIVNVDDAMAAAQREVAQLEREAGINLSQVPAIQRTIDGFREQIRAFTDDAGRAAFPLAQRFKTNTLDEVAQYAKKAPGQFTPELSAAAQAARTSRGALNEQMTAIEPRLAPLNREFAEMAQIEPFVEAAQTRGATNRFFSPQDLLTLGIGASGGVPAAIYSGEPSVALAALVPFLVSRMQKSPGAATGMYRLGNAMANPGPLGEGRKRAVESLLRSSNFGADPDSSDNQ